MSGNVIFQEGEFLRVRTNIDQIGISDGEPVIDETIQKLEETCAEDATLVGNLSTEKEGSMHICKRDNLTYEPSQKIQDKEPCHLNLKHL